MGADNYRSTKLGNRDASSATYPSTADQIGERERLVCKIMPLDLAIERELAYRARVEKVQGKLPSEFRQAPERSKRSTPSLNRSMMERKRKIVPDQLSSSLEGLKSFKPDSMHCQICNVPCCGMASFKQHRQGKKHAARVQEIMAATRSKEKIERNTRLKWDKMEWEMVV